MMGGDGGVVGGVGASVMWSGDGGGGVVRSIGCQGTKLSSSEMSSSDDSKIENRFSNLMKV
jgi:hypothetical protein